MPTGYPLRQLSRLWRIVLNGLQVVGIGWLEPKEAEDLLVRPEGMSYAADESKCRRPRTGLSISNDFLYEPPVFGSFSVIQWWVLYNLARGKPNERLGTEEPAREIEVDLIRKPIREDVVEVLWDVGGCRVVWVVA